MRLRCLVTGLALKIYRGLRQPRRLWNRLRYYKTTLIPFLRPAWDDREIRLGSAPVADVSLDDRTLFSAALRQALDLSGDERLVLTGSGRSAFALALRVLKAAHPERRTVLIPSYGCRGLFDPVVNSGLHPRFIESDPNLCPDADDMIAQMDEEVLACLIVHTSGKGMAVATVAEAACRFGICVIEDRCHALGLDSRRSFAPMHLYSFGIGKSAMATAGGALVSSILQAELEHEVAALGEEPATAASTRFEYYHRYYWVGAGHPSEPFPPHAATQYGNVRLSCLDASLMRVQLEKLPHFLEKRRFHAGIFADILAKRPDLFTTQSPGCHIYTCFSVTTKTRAVAAHFIQFMADRRIELERMYIPLHERTFATDTNRKKSSRNRPSPSGY